MVTGLIGSLVGAGAGVGMGFYNAYQSASEARAADKRQYRYALKTARNMPLAQRQGLEAAGYNPMLALGNIGGASAMPSHQGTSNVSFDGSSARALGEFFEKLAKDKAKADVDNIKADTALKKGQLDAVESQRLQNEANTSLLMSQAERSDLAYGRDIVDTVASVAGTAGSLYSAKAMSDVAKYNALTNRQNADRLSAGSERVTTHTDKHGKPLGETIQSDTPNRHPRANDKGRPLIKSSAKGATPAASGLLGGSSKTVGSIAKAVASELLMFAPFVGAGMALKPKVEDSSRRFQRRHKGERFWTPRRVLLH